MVGRRSKSAQSWNDVARRGYRTGKEVGPQTGGQARRPGWRGGHRELEGVRGSAREPGRRAQRRVRSPQKRRPYGTEGPGGLPRSLDPGLPPRKGGRPSARATWPASHIGEVLGSLGCGPPGCALIASAGPTTSTRTVLARRSRRVLLRNPSDINTPARAARGGPALGPPPHSGRRAGVPGRTD